MLMKKQFCFRKAFLPLLRRSGGALVAESEAWKKLERDFKSVYVAHVADEAIIATDLYRMAQQPDAIFILEIVGVPGVGKSKLIRELIKGLNPECFKFKDEVQKVRDTFEFVDVEKIKPPSERTGDKSEKRRVWVTLNIDEFVSVGETQNPLGELYQKLRQGLGKGESLIISGNIGVLEIKEAKHSIQEICKLIELRSNKRVEHLRYPEKPLYWTKEYGVKVESSGVEGDPYFLTSGFLGFRNYSLSIVEMAEKVLEKCTSSMDTRPSCKDCIGSVYHTYIKKTKKLLTNEDFVRRLHNILQFVWLKHRDVYLTARALNIFWGLTLARLWASLENEKKGGKTVQSSLIYEAIYSSKLPSIYSASEYPLLETRIHRLRDPTFESRFFGSYLPSLSDPSFRARKKLEYFFEELTESEYKEKMYGGALEEFMDEESLASNLTRVAKRLVLMRLDSSLLYVPEKFDEIYRDPWRFEKLMLATKLVGVPPIKIRVPLMIFDESLLNEVDIQAGVAFEEIEHPIYYLSHREKIARLKLKFGEGVPPSQRRVLTEKAPSLHINIEDYISLRSLAKGVGQPVVDLLPSTKVKVSSFLREIDGFVDHYIRPILWKHLKKHTETGDTSSILALTLGVDSKECKVKIRGEDLVIEQNGVEVFSCSRRHLVERIV